VRNAVPYLAAALADPYSAVRYVASRSLHRIDPESDVDYLGSDDERQRAALTILRRWEADHPGQLGAASQLIQRLVGERDNTRVRAME
jgi:hypothetical protein